MFDTDLLHDERYADLIAGASVVVGMHPDEATGAIVELATQLGKPFAVVPCCVFAADFPDRRLPNGKPVSSYEEFLDWLSSHAADTQRCRLPFVGKNHCLFRTLQSASLKTTPRDLPESLGQSKMPVAPKGSAWQRLATERE